MRKARNYLKAIVSTGVLFLYTSTVTAQECQCPETPIVVSTEPVSILTTIGVNDYPYFLNIKSLKKYSNIKNTWSTKFHPRIKYYTVKSKNKNNTLNAIYGVDGNLITGHFIQKDVPLPKIISRHLASEDYKDWTMTNNKIVIHDFDALKTEYEIKLQQGKMKQTLLFDYSGKPIKKLARIL